MKKTLEEHASRFDDHASAYDESTATEHRACASLVVEHAAPSADDVVLDMGTGTGAIALALADDAERVVGRDISEEMMARAREKADERGLENVTFDHGTFREPNVAGAVDAESSETPRAHARSAGVDIITSNFAMHHVDDDAKREAIAVAADLGPRRFVLGDIMFFDEPDPSASFYDPAVDDPATVGVLADALTDAGFSLTAVERVDDQVGVLVAERAPLEGAAVADAPEGAVDEVGDGDRDG
ncbi:class I SAM-dependent methyltransferase [Halobacteria archaeon AArc-dxtr1]|nr:class I SAM-dependent methyltransferase [Halobacteria archaeon AArc-dxtr1]